MSDEASGSQACAPENDRRAGTDGRPAPTLIFVCVSCGETEALSPEGAAATGRICPGRALFLALEVELSAQDEALRILPAACLAVCDRPVTIAFQSPGRWSYVVGDIDPEADVADVILAARAVARSPSGVPAMSERPPFFRKGVICRLPPLPAPRSDASF